MKLKDFKEKMTNHGLRVNDIQACKNPVSAIKYVTKEDRVPFICGVDWSKLKWLCKIKVIAEQFKFLDQAHPAAMSIPNIYRSVFSRYHSQFWDEMNHVKVYHITEEPLHIKNCYKIRGFF